MRWLRKVVSGWAGWVSPFFTAAERATVLGALKVAAYDLDATKGEPLITFTFWLGVFLVAIWWIDIVWQSAEHMWNHGAPPPAFLGPVSTAIAKLFALALGLGGILVVSTIAMAAIINAIAAAALK